MALFLIVSVFLSTKLKNMRLKVGKSSDQRLQRMQETLSAIKIIKMYVWENFFQQRIRESRRLVFLYELQYFIKIFLFVDINALNGYKTTTKCY